MPASFAPSAADKISPFTSWRIQHVALRVPDFDAAITWYTEKLDFRLMHSLPFAGLTFGFLSPAANDDVVIELLAGPGAENRPAYEDLPSSYRLYGWHHVGLRVESVRDAVAELHRRGVEIIREPRDVPAIGLRLAFFADPWGNLFEVTEPLQG